MRLALHPDDPPVPEPLGGVAQICSTLEQFRRIFFEIAPSQSNCMLFCQGCMTELLGPEKVYDAIAEMGSREMIAWVHFRNDHTPAIGPGFGRCTGRRMRSGISGRWWRWCMDEGGRSEANFENEERQSGAFALCTRDPEPDPSIRAMVPQVPRTKWKIGCEA